MTEGKDGWNYLEANAHHESGHAIVGWALGGRVLEIKIRDDRPGEHAQTEIPEDLRLIDRVAILNAGHEAEELFGISCQIGPAAVIARTLNLLAANEIREMPEIEGWIADGCAHARKVLRKHEREVHALAARLMECRRMATNSSASWTRSRVGSARPPRATPVSGAGWGARGCGEDRTPTHGYAESREAAMAAFVKTSRGE